MRTKSCPARALLTVFLTTIFLLICDAEAQTGKGNRESSSETNSADLAHRGGKDASSQQTEFDSVSGRWVMDMDYVLELWKEYRGTNYNDAEWAKILKQPGQITCDEVRLDANTIFFLNHGKLNSKYPVLGWKEEKGVVWVSWNDAIGGVFSPGKVTFGFVRTGERLKLIHSDRSWWLYSAYKRPTDQKQ